MPLPSGVKVEIEFVAGAWTDVTADVDHTRGLNIHVGRTTPDGQPQVSSVTVGLRNQTGKYTPSVQVLSDGTTAPYYPNVVPKKRLRYSNSSGVRFIGLIKSWTPQTNGFGGKSFCLVSAPDRMDSLGKITLDSPLMQEITSPSYLWPLTDPSGSSTAAEQSGNGGPAFTIGNPGGVALTFGDNGPGVGDGSGVKFSPTSTTNGQYLQTALPGRVGDVTAAAWQLWIQMPANPAATVTWLSVINGSNTMQIQVNTSGQVIYNHSVLGSVTGPVITGTAWQLVTVTSTKAGNVYTVTMRVGNTVAGTRVNVGSTATFTSTVVRIGQSAALNGAAAGNVGYVAYYPSNGPLTSTVIANQVSALTGWDGENLTARITRLLTYAGVLPADYALDTSTVTLGSYNTSGRSVLQAIQDAVQSEGGGSVFYVKAGIATFRNRAFRKPGSPALTVAISTDDDASGYQPVLDDANLVNQANAQRATASGTQSTQTFTDAPSVAMYGVASQDVTTYSNSDSDALNLAQSVVAAGRNPAWRLPGITVDMLTSPNNLYAALQTIEIGSRIRVTGLPAAQAPATQVDLLVEGWTETVAFNQYTVQFDASPADNPARLVWDDTTYGRWQASPDCALNASLTNAATTVVIKSPTLPTFTTVSARYPLTIQVDGEQIRLNTAPGGSSSPQTFTGVTRGVNGTTAAAHASNAIVALAPAATWTL